MNIVVYKGLKIDDYAKGSSMQNILLKRLHTGGILEADDMPLAFDMTPSRQGEVHSNPWFSSISTLETPRILLNSGIQGPAIGRYLTSHVP